MKAHHENNIISVEPIIGCEIHCQLSTQTKAFCSCENRYGGMPNTRVCPVCLGLPGALPVISSEYVKLGIKAGLAFGGTISRICKFDRKHYFYPDLVKGYQITQYDVPISSGGTVNINIADYGKPPIWKTVRLERIHLEEDAGKSLHIEGSHSYIDYNRCGVPLIEIVSKPDMNSPEEASAYMQTVREILHFIGITDGNLEEGAMRCDANINIKIIEVDAHGQQHERRTPISEVKNLNSFKAVREACAYEIERQYQEFLSDQRCEFVAGFKRTMGWDEATGKTVIQRTKNSIVDYRFMREPDIHAFTIEDHDVETIAKTVGELPEAKRVRFKSDYGLSDFDVQTLTSERSLAQWFEEALIHAKDPKKIANWILAEVLAVTNGQNITLSELAFSPADLAQLVNAISDNTITGLQAKEVFAIMVKTGKNPSAIIAEKGFEQVSDEGFIEEIVDAVFAENPKALEDWKNGKTNVAGWLMGQVMKKSKGKANPTQATACVTSRLKKL